ncbi:MAG: universal stress protein [Reichenbachiella sp.]|uniref:universal stress protein n=1 Tax=Reichenbachiella sp. TaxID=2184521 RepID=UPI002966DE20|nr:universal stress protein [Reichenbachiella sp.]MDW3208253.1 universal stress protein [Reichenbachiella sp.]
MQYLKKFLVCLDSTPLDEHIIQYSSMAAELTGCEKVYFVHIAQKNLSLKVKKYFQEKIQEHFTASCETEMQIHQGNNAVQILKWSEFKIVDLVILGIKPKSESTGKHAARLINAAQCSVLLVPPTAKLKLSRVIIPLDFSASSITALNAAMNFKEKVTDIEILLHHVYFVPSGYTHTGKSYDEMADIMDKNKRREYEQFKREYSVDESKFEVIFELDEDQNPSDNIYEMAKERNADMIIVASRGRTKMASLLKGSTAVNLISYDREIACLVVKNKAENMGFFEALLKL